MKPISKEILKDVSGKVIGTLETDNEGNQQIRDFYGNIKGTYDVKMKCTRDFYGKIVAQGNLLFMLLRK